MSKGIILFQSKYGATKKYADWLAETSLYPPIPRGRKVVLPGAVGLSASS